MCSGISKKNASINDFCKKNKNLFKKITYVGNDINDLQVMKLVGYTYCPADAHPMIKEISQHILVSKGGEGVVREIYDILIQP